MLNSDLRLSTLEEFLKKGEGYFVRPVGDFKTFAGEYVHENKDDWYNEKSYRGALFSKGVDVMYASYKDIGAEIRCFIVDGKIVTASYYRQKGKLIPTPYPHWKLDILQPFADRWLPINTVVMDLAITLDGVKVIEFNCINASGFYSCDVEALVKAIK
jgi:ATP-grasp domain, R2K clade family 3